MSYVRIIVHAVWGTHNHEPVLLPGKTERLLEHIRINAKIKGIHIEALNGCVDHIHCLLSLGADQNIAGVIKLIKGESAYWANQEKLFRRLKWKEDYYAASVSNSALGIVREYIRNQYEHHKKLTYIQEYERFIESNSQSLD